MKNDTSASSGELCVGRCQVRSTWDTMFCRYSGNGNATPSVLTVAMSLPVEGVSPGSGWFAGVVRGAASRLVRSRVGGGTARETVLLVVCSDGRGARCTSGGAFDALGHLR